MLICSIAAFRTAFAISMMMAARSLALVRHLICDSCDANIYVLKFIYANRKGAEWRPRLFKSDQGTLSK